jgi:hypothetical protein
MKSDFKISLAPVTTHRLVVYDRYHPPAVLIEFNVFVHNNCEIYKQSGMSQFEDYLSEILDELPREKWNKEDILHVVSEFMREVPFSHSLRVVS